MIDHRTGALILSTARIGRDLTRSAFLSTPMGERCHREDVRNGWMHVHLQPQVLSASSRSASTSSSGRAARRLQPGDLGSEVRNLLGRLVRGEAARPAGRARRVARRVAWAGGARSESARDGASIRVSLGQGLVDVRCAGRVVVDRGAVPARVGPGRLARRYLDSLRFAACLRSSRRLLTVRCAGVQPWVWPASATRILDRRSAFARSPRSSRRSRARGVFAMRASATR
jgi:hypothetical protein